MIENQAKPDSDTIRSLIEATDLQRKLEDERKLVDQDFEKRIAEVKMNVSRELHRLIQDGKIQTASLLYYQGRLFRVMEGPRRVSPYWLGDLECTVVG